MPLLYVALLSTRTCIAFSMPACGGTLDLPVVALLIGLSQMPLCLFMCLLALSVCLSTQASQHAKQHCRVCMQLQAHLPADSFVQTAPHQPNTTVVSGDLSKVQAAVQASDLLVTPDGMQRAFQVLTSSCHLSIALFAWSASMPFPNTTEVIYSFCSRCSFASLCPTL